MLEVSTPTVAWISVVLVQAIIHYFVFGARRERIQQETEAVLLEESFSFCTYEGSMESDYDLDLTSTPNTPTAAPSFSSISSLSSVACQNEDLTTASETISFPSTEREVYIKFRETDIDENSPFYLMQTGTEMLKSCSLKNVVEEQIRLVPQ